MTAYTKDQAKVVDTKLAEDQKALYKATERRNTVVVGMACAAGSKTAYYGRQAFQSFDGIVPAEGADARAKLIERRDGGSLPAWELPRVEKLLADYDEVELKVNQLKEAVNAAHKEWESNGRWSRFFLVQGGHIHSSTHCHTLKITTRLGWLPDLSGETEKDAVDAHGALLCTVCFPSAPVEWTVGAKPADDECEGGRPADANFRRRSVYGTCPSCGEWVSVTSTGKARKHKKPIKKEA